jgi:1-deoxy-D-xylulose-5-phosphate synthase
MVLPDRFIDHDAPLAQYDQAHLNAKHIVDTAINALGRAVDRAAHA